MERETKKMRKRATEEAWRHGNVGDILVSTGVRLLVSLTAVLPDSIYRQGCQQCHSTVVVLRLVQSKRAEGQVAPSSGQLLLRLHVLLLSTGTQAWHSCWRYLGLRHPASGFMSFSTLPADNDSGISGVTLPSGHLGAEATSWTSKLNLEARRKRSQLEAWILLRFSVQDDLTRLPLTRAEATRSSHHISDIASGVWGIATRRAMRSRKRGARVAVHQDPMFFFGQIGRNTSSIRWPP